VRTTLLVRSPHSGETAQEYHAREAEAHDRFARRANTSCERRRWPERLESKEGDGAVTAR